MFAETTMDFDVMLTPSVPGAAPHGLATIAIPPPTGCGPCSGTLCVNASGLFDNDGLALSIQIVSRFGRDRAALEVALFGEDVISRKVGG